MSAAASRLLFAFARDGFAPGRVAALSKDGSPATSLLTGLAASALTVVIFALAGIPGDHLFFYLGTIGTLLLLVAYAEVNVGALRWILTGRLPGGRTAALLPAAALLVLGFALYSNVWPVPDPPFNLFPYVALGWLALGGAVIALRPEQPRRAGQFLVQAEVGAGPGTPVQGRTAVPEGAAAGSEPAAAPGVEGAPGTAE